MRRERDLQAETEALEARESELEDEINELEQDSEEYDEFVKERLKTLYELAAEFHALAEEEYATALSYTENGDWASAAKFFGVAFRGYDVATEYTFQAGTIAADEGYPDAEEVARGSNNYVDDMAEACNHYSVGAQHFANGENRSAEREFDQGDSYFEEAQESDFRSQREFEVML